LQQKRRRKGASYRRLFGFCAAECLSVNLNLSCSFAIAAEQKARVTYDNILRICDDPDVANVIKYLRQREIVHFQRFGEALDKLQEAKCEKNSFYINR
jgi:Mn-containing catalase